MATNPSQIPEDLTTPVPLRAHPRRIRKPPNPTAKPSPTAKSQPAAFAARLRTNNQARPFLAYLAFRSIFLPHESAGRGAYLSFLSQSAFFFRKLCGVGKPGQRARAGYRGEGPIGVLQPGAGQRRFFPAHICREVMRRPAPAEQRLVSRRGSLHRQCRD